MSQPMTALVLITAGEPLMREDDVRAYLPFNGEGWNVIQMTVANYVGARQAIQTRLFQAAFVTAGTAVEAIMECELTVIPHRNFMNEAVCEAARQLTMSREFRRRMMAMKIDKEERRNTMVQLLESLAAHAESISQQRDAAPEEGGLAWLWNNLEDEIHVLKAYAFSAAYPIRQTFLGVDGVIRIDKYGRIAPTPAAWRSIIENAERAGYEVVVTDEHRMHAKSHRADQLYLIYCCA